MYLKVKYKYTYIYTERSVEFEEIEPENILN